MVIHADVPSNPATLLHRSGRTGRAGRKGTCVLIVPENRRGAAQRVLGLAKLTATVRAAPGIAEIEARYRRQILDTALSAAELDEGEAAFVKELLSQISAERIVAAFLRQQLAARPVPEDLSPLPVGETQTGKGKRDKQREAERSPAERGPDMEGGVWFTMSLGRKQRADPKWLLPMICKAGGVSKRDVGSIRINDTETHFEISAEKASDFAERISKPGGTERGIVITPAMKAGEGQTDQQLMSSPKPFKKPHRKGGSGENRSGAKFTAGKHTDGKPWGKPGDKKPKHGT
jgi:ATP-dependent RNA helicase DeaD